MAYNILALLLLHPFLCAGVQLSRLNSEDENYAMVTDGNLVDDENYAAVIDSNGNLVDINNLNLTELADVNRSEAHKDIHDMPEHLRYLPMRFCWSLGCVKHYVQLRDPTYHWTHLSERKHTVDGVELTQYTLNMTSQRWLSGFQVSKENWTHEIIINVPSTLDKGSPTSKWATLFLAGSNETQNVELEHAAYAAAKTGSIGAVIKGIPNEDLVFPDDTQNLSRSEDNLQAYTRMVFLYNNKPEWLVELPMTKAVMRAMDTITSFAKSEVGIKVEKFGVAGHSMRAQVTWMLAAVDDRVQAIIPASHSLNAKKQREHAHASLGNYAWVQEPYRVLITVPWSKNTQNAAFITDPAWYSEKVKVPKLVMMGGNDEYFPIGSERFYWPKLVEPKTYLMEPNADQMDTWSSAGKAATAFMYAVIHDAEYPKIDWEIDEKTGAISAQQLTHHTPTVTLWQATTCNNKRRDFRVVTAVNETECAQCGYQIADGKCYNTKVQWTSSKVEEGGQRGMYVAGVEPPSDGRWTAFFLRFEYPSMKEGLPPVKLSTGASVMPNNYPFKFCKGVACYGDALV